MAIAQSENRTLRGLFSRCGLIGLLLIATINSLPAQKASPSELEQAHNRHKDLSWYNQPGENLRVALGSSASGSVIKEDVRDGGDNLETPQNAEAEFTTAVCQADAIVIGKVSSLLAMLSTSETAVFTDYSISPLEILKNSTQLPITSKTAFTLTRPGGEVHLEAGTIQENEHDYPTLSLGKKYLLFLTALPESTKLYKS